MFVFTAARRTDVQPRGGPGITYLAGAGRARRLHRRHASPVFPISRIALPRFNTRVRRAQPMRDWTRQASALAVESRYGAGIYGAALALDGGGLRARALSLGRSGRLLTDGAPPDDNRIQPRANCLRRQTAKPETLPFYRLLPYSDNNRIQIKRALLSSMTFFGLVSKATGTLRHASRSRNPLRINGDNCARLRRRRQRQRSQRQLHQALATSLQRLAQQSVFDNRATDLAAGAANRYAAAEPRAGIPPMQAAYAPSETDTARHSANTCGSLLSSREKPGTIVSIFPTTSSGGRRAIRYSIGVGDRVGTGPA